MKSRKSSETGLTPSPIGGLQTSMVTELVKGLGEAAEKVTIPDPVRWIEKEFYIPETKNDPKLRGRIGLENYQKDVLREALQTDENGNYRYSIVVWSDIKKSGKSTIAAAINLYRASFTEWGEFYIVANDLKQADSRVTQYLRRAIGLNPRMRDKYRLKGYRIICPSGSYLEAVPIDPSGEAGSNADQITFSELWGANEEAQQKMWVEMTIPPGKYGKAFRLVESYAGFSEESELLYSLYELGVKQGELLWPNRLYPVTDGEPAPLELYVNRDAGMLCLWNTLPRCPWQTRAYYASEEKILPTNQFARVHRNQWVSSTETFVPMEWYRACRRSESEWPQYSDDLEGVARSKFSKSRHNCIIALDAATSNDSFGLTMGCRHPDMPDHILLEFQQRWLPDPQTGKIDFIGTDEKPGPEKVLDRLTEQYNVVMCTYDPYQLHDFAMRQRKRGRVWMKEFNQGNDRAKADSQFRDIIRDRRFWHRGEQEIYEHIQNANAKLDDQDSKVRLVKRTEKLKIDLAVCGSMMCYQLMRLNL